MKTRKLILTSLFVILVGGTTSSNAGWFDSLRNIQHGYKIDDQGRRLKNHERPNTRAGHTIKKHINIHMYDVAKRCKEPGNTIGNFTRFKKDSAFMKLKASLHIRRSIKANQREINNFAKNRSRKSRYISNIPNGVGEGVTCSQVNRFNLFRILWNKYYIGPINYNHPYLLVNIIRDSQEKGGWYLYRSYPTHINR